MLHNKIEIEVAGMLYAKRKELGYTQEQIADGIGISRYQYQMMEKGKINIPVSILGKFAEFVNIKFLFSVYGTGITNPEKGHPQFEVGDKCKIKLWGEVKTGIVVAKSETTFTADIEDELTITEIPNSKFKR